MLYIVKYCKIFIVALFISINTILITLAYLLQNPPQGLLPGLNLCHFFVFAGKKKWPWVSSIILCFPVEFIGLWVFQRYISDVILHVYTAIFDI